MYMVTGGSGFIGSNIVAALAAAVRISRYATGCTTMNDGAIFRSMRLPTSWPRTTSRIGRAEIKMALRR